MAGEFQFDPETGLLADSGQQGFQFDPNTGLLADSPAAQAPPPAQPTPTSSPDWWEEYWGPLKDHASRAYNNSLDGKPVSMPETDPITAKDLLDKRTALQQQIFDGADPNTDGETRANARLAAQRLAKIDHVLGTMGNPTGELATGVQKPGDIIDALPHEKLMASDRYQQAYDAASPVLGADDAHAYAKNVVANDAHFIPYMSDSIFSDLMGAPKATAFDKNYNPPAPPTPQAELAAVEPGYASETATDFGTGGGALTPEAFKAGMRVPSIIGYDLLEGTMQAAKVPALTAAGLLTLFDGDTQAAQDFLFKYGVKPQDDMIAMARANKPIPVGVGEQAVDKVAQMIPGLVAMAATKNPELLTTSAADLFSLPLWRQVWQQAVETTVQQMPAAAVGSVPGALERGQQIAEQGGSPAAAALGTTEELASGTIKMSMPMARGGAWWEKAISGGSAFTAQDMADAAAAGQPITAASVIASMAVGAAMGQMHQEQQKIMLPKFANAMSALEHDPENMSRLTWVAETMKDKGPAGGLWASAELHNITVNGETRDEAAYQEWKAAKAVTEPTAAEQAPGEGQTTLQAAEDLVGAPGQPLNVTPPPIGSPGALDTTAIHVLPPLPPDEHPGAQVPPAAVEPEAAPVGAPGLEAVAKERLQPTAPPAEAPAVRVTDAQATEAAHAQAEADRARQEAEIEHERQSGDVQTATSIAASEDAAREAAARGQGPPEEPLLAQKLREAGVVPPAEKTEAPDLRLAAPEGEEPEQRAALGQPAGDTGIPKDLPTVKSAETDKLSAALNEHAPDPTGAKIDLAEVSRAHLPPEVQTAINEVEKFTGTQVHVIRDNTPGWEGRVRFNGAMYTGHLFVNENSQHPIVHVLAHEWTHQLKRTAAPLYQILENEIKRQGGVEAYGKSAMGRGYKPEKAAEELTADTNGDALGDRTFMQKMATENPTAFGKLASSFGKYLDTFLGRQTKDMGSNRFVKQVDTYRQLLSAVMHTHALEAGEKAGTMRRVAAPAMRMAPDEEALPQGVSEHEISTRLPTAKAATEDPMREQLVTGVDAMKKDPEAFKHNVDLVSKGVFKGGSSAEKLINHFRDNLLWLHDQFAPEIRARARQWYDGAHKIATAAAKLHDVPRRAASGVYAALSPQKDWFMNVSLGNRVMQTVKNHWDTKWTPEMEKTAGRIYNKTVKPATLAELRSHTPESLAALKESAQTNEADEKTYKRLKTAQNTLDNNVRYAEMLKSVRGKSMADLEGAGVKPKERLALQAMWLRAHDETYNTREYNVIHPEGGEGDRVLNEKGKNKGKPAKVAWGSLSEIGKAISIMRDPSRENISARVGKMHKVRNFYNNIESPNSALGHVTSDTHNVAAAHILPLAGGSDEVARNFGGKGAASSAITGNSGTYGLYHEAIRRAAEARGILPREMQSITWEAVRGLFPKEWKTKDNVKAARKVWNEFKQGRIDANEARNQILQLAGGIRDPSWHRPGAGLHAVEGHPGDAGELHQPELAGRPAEAVDTGARGGDAGGAPDEGVDFRLPQQSRARADAAEPFISERLARAQDDAKAWGYGSGSSSPDQRIRGIKARFEPSEDLQRVMTESGATPAAFNELVPHSGNVDKFHSAISASKEASKFGAAVYVYPKGEYAGMRMFLTDDGRTGFALKPDGDLVSGFSDGGGKVHSMLQLGVEQGGKKTDCFDTVLPELYAINGFREVRREPWDESQKPPDWDKKTFANFNHGEPDIVYLEHDPTYNPVTEEPEFHLPMAEENVPPHSDETEDGEPVRTIKSSIGNLHIETDKGQTRTGTTEEGKPFSTVMKHPYGYVEGVPGRDGGSMDVLVANETADPSRPVFVIHQKNAEGGFDEHKVVVGAKNQRDAERAYLSEYPKGWDRMGQVEQYTPAQFKEWARTTGREQAQVGKVDPNVPRANIRGQQPDAVAMHAVTDRPLPQKTANEHGRLDLPNAVKGIASRTQFTSAEDGGGKHETVLRNLYDAKADPRGLFDMARDTLDAHKLPVDLPHIMNEFERLVIAHGFDGYKTPDGQATVLGAKVPMRARGEEKASGKLVPELTESGAGRVAERADENAGRDNAPVRESKAPARADETQGDEGTGKGAGKGEGVRVPDEQAGQTSHQGLTAEHEASSIANVDTEAARLARGKEMIEKIRGKTGEELHAAAHEELRKNPNRGREIANEVANTPRNISDVEAAILAVDRQRIVRAHDDATKRASDAMDLKDHDATQVALSMMKLHEAEREANEKAAVNAGTEWSNSGLARRLLVRPDESYGGLLAARKVKAGRDLTETERTAIKKDADERARLKDKIESPGLKDKPEMVVNNAKKKFADALEDFKKLKREEMMTKECYL